MNSNEVVRAASGAQLPRREFLQKTMLASLPATLALAGVPMTAAAAVMSSPAMTLSVHVPPTRARGSASLNVRDYGAVGDGVMDDTAAFQRAINALPAAGGTVNVPSGTYLIDPIKNLRLRSLMHLQLSAAATLKAKPNSAERAYVLNVHSVSDVEISGGRIIGERDQHLGTTGEHGHGIMVRGSSRVTVRDIHISKCWGDGMQITNIKEVMSDDVVLANIACTFNRRQGLSISGSRNVKVYDSEFSYTKGTLPECGIDIEPEVIGLPTADKVLIQNCWLHNNNKNGILIYQRVSGVHLLDCTIEHNGGYGIYTYAPVGGWIARNKIQHNYYGALYFTKITKNFKVSGNTFRNNNTRFFGVRLTPTPLTALTGVVAGYGAIQQTADCVNIDVTTNFYSKN